MACENPRTPDSNWRREREILFWVTKTGGEMNDRIYSVARMHEERERAARWAVGMVVLWSETDPREYTAGKVRELVRRALELLPEEPDDEVGF